MHLFRVQTRRSPTGSVATISAADREAVCADSTATGCSVKMWQIRPEDTTLPTFLTYDEAVHPSAITEVWLRCVTEKHDGNFLGGQGGSKEECRLTCVRVSPVFFQLSLFRECSDEEAGVMYVAFLFFNCNKNTHPVIWMGV